jgi:hypothetical protein
MVLNQGRLQCHHIHTKFHPKSKNGLKGIKEVFYTHLRSLNVRHFISKALFTQSKSTVTNLATYLDSIAPLIYLQRQIEAIYEISAVLWPSSSHLVSS